jgi:hypothetical protein
MKSPAVLALALLAGCASASGPGTAPAPAAAPKSENFTYRVTGIKGQPGYISDD